MLVRIQNQKSPHTVKLDKPEMVAATLVNSQYKVDGCGMITHRSMVFVRRIIPFAQMVEPKGVREDQPMKDNQGLVVAQQLPRETKLEP